MLSFRRSAGKSLLEPAASFTLSSSLSLILGKGIAQGHDFINFWAKTICEMPMRSANYSHGYRHCQNGPVPQTSHRDTLYLNPAWQ